ncbi:40S ribosomal protein S7 [Teratosphaeria destructans]|uniref:40S ribosomal protein S7 n=1 Tax=Teratosphaeria destructans TaxID=418781 RepID=A0A9W7SUN8_9PEZI|nr:40S ribosomal protein S7 [Teratosphaeria destructans]
MDDPIAVIEPVIRALTQGTPKEQEEAVNKYCTPDFAFTHPFCRTGSFQGSRLVYRYILRWYKIMSPKIDIQINSIGKSMTSLCDLRNEKTHEFWPAFDETNLILYVNCSQVFAIWFLPFHRSPVTLTTVLNLTRTNPTTSATARSTYLITSQNDLYQVDQFVRFFAPWGIGDLTVLIWHAIATISCVLLAFVCTPFSVLEQGAAEGKAGWVGRRFMEWVWGVEGEREKKGRWDWRQYGREERSFSREASKVVDGVGRRFGREVERVNGGSSGDGQFGDMQVRVPPTANMSTQALNKIAPNSPSRAKPSEIETNIATALYELESNIADMKAALRPLQFVSARERSWALEISFNALTTRNLQIEVGHGRKAIVIFVPVPLLGGWHRSQQRLTRELEKKFSDRHVLIVASRRILPRPKRSNRSRTTQTQKRPRSRTLTAVHDAILADLVYPVEIVGKRVRTREDGSKILKIVLDEKERGGVDYRLDTYSEVYKRLTGKGVNFEFPQTGPSDY